MASVMAENGIFGERRRRQMTYGKKAKRRDDKNNNNHKIHDTTPTTLSRTHKISPPQGASLKQAEDNNVFDVPLSDDDETPKAHEHTKTGNPSHPAIVKSNLASSTAPSDATKKRKRLDLTGASVPKPSSLRGDTRRSEFSGTEGTAWNPLDQDEDMGSDGTNNSCKTRSRSAASSTQGKHETRSSGRAKAGVRKGKPLNKRRLLSSKTTLDLSRSESSSVEPPQTPQRSMGCLDDPAPSVSPSAPTPGLTGTARRPLSTPRQRQLWDDLLGADDTPIPMKKLGPKSPQHPGRRSEDQQSQPGGSQRLVDALLPAPGSDPISSDDHEETSMRLVEEVEDINASRPPVLVPSSQPGSQVPTAITGGPRVTYGQQRSFLSEVPDSIDSILSQPLDVETSPTGGSTLVAQNHSENVEDEDEDANGSMRNIHELRAAGDSRRFNDEIDRLLVDISDSKKSALSRKRSALLELNTSLADDSFKNRLTNSVYLGQIFSHCRAEKDTITASAVSGAIALILRNPEDAHCASQLCGIGVMRTLVSALDLPRDLRTISRDRSTNMSKFAQGTVSEFEKVIRAAFSWTDSGLPNPSPQLIALKALELLIRRLRNLGNAEMVIDHDTLPKLLAIADDASRKISPKSDDQLLRLVTALSIVESCCIATVTASTNISIYWTRSRLALLVDCLDTCLGLEALKESEAGPLSLRICVNLANNNQEISEQFARSTFVGRLMHLIQTDLETLSSTIGEDEHVREFDILVLALGALFNLGEMSDNVRQIAAEEFPDALSAMVKHFQVGQSRSVEADSIDASRANIPYGWLAVLLGNLCQNETARHRFQRELPRGRLTCLWQAIDEFIQHHREADRQEGAGEVQTILINRLQAHAENVKRWDAKPSW